MFDFKNLMDDVLDVRKQDDFNYIVRVNHYIIVFYTDVEFYMKQW